MGLFDSLFGKRKPTKVEMVTDHIWMSTAAKYKGLATEFADRSKSGTTAVLLVAHFPDVLEKLEELANSQTVDVPVKAVLAGTLSPAAAVTFGFAESDLIDFIVAERHPLRSEDEILEEFAEQLPCRSRLVHHVSLDDPVFQVFAGKWVRDILTKLGMTEDEAIESEMVTRRIKSAQDKIAAKSYGTTDAESATQWLEQNCPELEYK